jgi:hypothetical protein
VTPNSKLRGAFLDRAPIRIPIFIIGDDLHNTLGQGSHIITLGVEAGPARGNTPPQAGAGCCGIIAGHGSDWGGGWRLSD